MNYSDTTNKTGIIQRNEMLCSMGDGAISGDATLLKQFTGLNNESYYEVWMAEMSVNYKARADDYNYTDLPDAPIALVAGQADYTLPVAVASANVATFLRLNGLYYKMGNERIYLRPMQSNETRSDTQGTPTAYQLNGKSFIFDRPVSSDFVSRVTYIHAEFQRVPDAFLSVDTTQQPGFMETYHDLIPLRSSAKYLMPIDMNTATAYNNEFLRRLELFKRDVAKLDDSYDSSFTSEPIKFR